ncbi:MAG: MGMT family protein [Myxococcaceae bacterium]
MAFSVHETPLGLCAVEWSEAGVQRLAFGRLAELRHHWLAARGGVESRRPPRFVREATARLRAHLSGRPQDFTSVPLDLSATSPGFQELASSLRGTPAGATLDVEQLAARLTLSTARVRQLLARNPLPVLLPSHRMLGPAGLLGAWGGGEVLQERLLALESMAHPPLYGLDGQPAPARIEEALQYLQRRDPALAVVMEQVGPYRLRLRSGHSPYEALARAILGQQISGRAAAAILARLASQFGTPGVPAPGRILGAKDGALRAAGLSAGKARAFRDLAARTLAGQVPGWAVLRRWPDERILATLTEIHGIGRWTVEMVLLFRLGRPDVLPLGDLGIRKGYARALGQGRLPSSRQLQRRGWRWRPFRSVASWYLWRALELP